MSDSDLVCFLKRECSRSVQVKVHIYSLLYLCIPKYHLEHAAFYDCVLKFSVSLHEHWRSCQKSLNSR